MAAGVVVRNALDVVLVLNAVVFTPLAISSHLRHRRARLQLEAARAWLPLRPGMGARIIPLDGFERAGRRPTA